MARSKRSNVVDSGQAEREGHLFVCGKRPDSPAGADLISEWDRARHLIGNHSYSHMNFNESSDASNAEGVTLAQFEADALKYEPLIRSYSKFSASVSVSVLQKRRHRREARWHAFFLAGARLPDWRVTIDASDWAIDARLAKKANAAHDDLEDYRDFFLEHIWQRAQYYDSLASRLMLTPVRHTLLLHHNALNALFLGDLITMLHKKG